MVAVGFYILILKVYYWLPAKITVAHGCSHSSMVLKSRLSTSLEAVKTRRFCFTYLALLRVVEKSIPSHKFSIVIVVCTFEESSRFACSAAAFNLQVLNCSISSSFIHELWEESITV